MHKILPIISFIMLVLLLAGCAGTQSRNTDPENDPWEGYNRKVYAFNEGMDKVVRPIAVGYDKIMPDPLQRGVGNFFRNLDAPVTYVNLLLQGKFRESADAFGRFFINSTVGLLGFFDVASRLGIPFYNEDLGQTMATWGYDDSRYLMLPFFGPSTFRDGTGRLADSFYHPVGR
ncbi:MAG: VacJ family lipoprotein, partial [Deltaproteobacteria bacterium]